MPLLGLLIAIAIALTQSCASIADSTPISSATPHVVDGTIFSDCPKTNSPDVPFPPNAVRTQKVGLFNFGVVALRLAPEQEELLFLSNGQDQGPQPLVAIRPNENSWPSWYSRDFDFQGRLAAGDIDGSGYPEIAVPVFADNYRNYSGGELHIYKNEKGVLEPTAHTRIDLGGALLEVTLGDADGDGDLDAATSILGKDGTVPGRPPLGSGETIIMENQNGTIVDNRFWTADDVKECQLPLGKGIHCNFVFGMLFADVNQDGIMDLVANGNRLRIYYGELVAAGTTDEKTRISKKPGWQSDEYWDVGYDLSLAWKDRKKRTLMIAVSSYSPVPGHKYPFRIYVPTKATKASWASSKDSTDVPHAGGGGLVLHDVNDDSYPDLIASSQGINKHPMRIYMGTKTGYKPTPDYCSGTASTSQPRRINCGGSLFFGGTIVEAEGDNGHQTTCETFSIGTPKSIPGNKDDDTSNCQHTILAKDHAGYVFTLQRDFSYIQSVKIDGTSLGRKQFAFESGGMTVSVGKKVMPAAKVEITYQYSAHPNLVIADMDPLCGPGIFSNQP